MVSLFVGELVGWSFGWFVSTTISKQAKVRVKRVSGQDIKNDHKTIPPPQKKSKTTLKMKMTSKIKMTPKNTEFLFNFDLIDKMTP